MLKGLATRDNIVMMVELERCGGWEWGTLYSITERTATRLGHYFQREYSTDLPWAGSGGGQVEYRVAKI